MNLSQDRKQKVTSKYAPVARVAAALRILGCPAPLRLPQLLWAPLVSPGHQAVTRVRGEDVGSRPGRLPLPSSCWAPAGPQLHPGAPLGGDTARRKYPQGHARSQNPGHGGEGEGLVPFRYYPPPPFDVSGVWLADMLADAPSELWVTSSEVKVLSLGTGCVKQDYRLETSGGDEMSLRS